jgi:hypothetical protein
VPGFRVEAPFLHGVAEWLGELSALPTRRARVRFAAQTLLGMARLAVILHWPAGSK